MESLKILIPTDFSVQAEYAYLLVKKLEEKIKTEIHFLHVMNVPDTVTLSPNGEVQTCGEIDVNYVLSQKQIVERKLQNLQALYGSHIQIHLVFGKTTDAIISFAEKGSFELIVMGTKGAWGLKEKLSGSETQIIARKSPVPLLSLMCDRSELSINHILLVHNFKETIQKDLSLLQKFIKAFDAKIHLLQIAKLKDENEKNQLLELMAIEAKRHNIVNYERHILDDMDVESGVIHFNEMHNMDLICIGTHGKGGFFHTSATEKLINHLFKPIISFHLNN